MCHHTILKSNSHGYVVQCDSCRHIQVAFGTCILSLTADQFDELIDTAQAMYLCHQHSPFPEQKMIQVPTSCRTVTMVFSVYELKNFIGLLTEGRKKLQYKKLFVFHEN